MFGSTSGINSQIGSMLSESTSCLKKLHPTLKFRTSIDFKRQLSRLTNSTPALVHTSTSNNGEAPMSTSTKDAASTIAIDSQNVATVDAHKSSSATATNEKKPKHCAAKGNKKARPVEFGPSTWTLEHSELGTRDIAQLIDQCPQMEIIFRDNVSMATVTKNLLRTPSTLTTGQHLARTNTPFPQTESYISSPSFALNKSSPLLMHHPAVNNVPHRTYFGGKGQSRTSDGEIEFLEKNANRHVNDPSHQARYLKAIVNVDPQYVIRRYESGKYAHNEQSKNEYHKALFLTDNLSWNEVKRQLGGSSAGGASISGLDSSGVGSRDRPMHVQVTQHQYADEMFQKIPWLRALPAMARGATRLFLLVVIGVMLYRLMGENSPTGMMGKITGMDSKEVKPDSSALKCRFEDVQGCDEAKEELQTIVEFLRNPEKFTRLGGRMQKGMLLEGRPGTGKTLLARAIAGEAGVPFYFATGSEFDEVFVGVGSARIRSLFAAAKARAPSIIFIDEIDAVAGKRKNNSMTSQYANQTINQLLTELDGFEPSDGVIVIGATNFAQSLDPALTRPGRFDMKVNVPLPDVKGRTDIFKVYFKNKPVADDVDAEIMARGTPGFTGADIENVVNQAALKAAQDDDTEISMEHLLWAKDKVLMGPERKSAIIPKRQMEMTAYHEAGHAMVAYFTKDADPIHKATIMPRGQTGGMVMLLPKADKLNWTKAQYLARIDVAMGGRVAEEIMYGEDGVTEGASSDMEGATNIAKAMVKQFGMSEKIGLQKIEEGEKLSPDLRKRIEDEINRILQESYERATNILKKNSKEHKRLAKALIEHETLTGEQVEAAINNTLVITKK